jgi:predicted ArsR family transcriptional regulator
VPRRDYQLAARILAGTVAALGDTASSVMAEVARDTGRTLAAPFATAAEDAEYGPRCLGVLLTAVGYEPYTADEVTRLRNCPFHRAAENHRELVCTANVHLLSAIVDELAPHMLTDLEPVPGECCVQLQGTR